jgi:hypothetical protein
VVHLDHGRSGELPVIRRVIIRRAIITYQMTQQLSCTFADSWTVIMIVLERPSYYRFVRVIGVLIFAGVWAPTGFVLPRAWPSG